MASWKGRESVGREIGTGAMSDEIIHLEEVIRKRKRIRFGDASDQPRVFSENCLERCFPVPVEASPRNFRSESLENLETEFTAKLGNFGDFEERTRGEKLDALTSPSMRLLSPTTSREEEACISVGEASLFSRRNRAGSFFLVKLILFFFFFFSGEKLTPRLSIFYRSNLGPVSVFQLIFRFHYSVLIDYFFYRVIFLIQ